MKKFVLTIIAISFILGIFLTTEANSATTYEMEITNPETGETFTLLLETPEGALENTGEMTLKDPATGEQHTVSINVPTEAEIEAEVLAKGPYLYEQCKACISPSARNLNIDEKYEALRILADTNPEMVRADGTSISDAELLTLATYMTNHLE